MSIVLIVNISKMNKKLETILTLKRKLLTMQKDLDKIAAKDK